MMILVKWLLACLILAMLMKPLFSFDNLKLVDEGCSVFLGLGSGIAFLFTWFICAVTHLAFNSYSCVFLTLLLSSAAAYWRMKGGRFKERDPEEIKRARRRFFIGFAVFAVLFLAAVWVKGFKPIIDNQTEQYMDYGFMAAIYRQQKVPFEDLWWCGWQVNYY